MSKSDLIQFHYLRKKYEMHSDTLMMLIESYGVNNIYDLIPNLLEKCWKQPEFKFV